MPPKLLFFLIFIFFIFLFPLHFTFAAAEVPHSAIISGHVKSQGVGIANAIVSASSDKSCYSNCARYIATTTDDGYYFFEVSTIENEDNFYDFQISAREYKEKTEKINILSDSEMNLDFDLEPGDFKIPIIIVPGIIGSYLNENVSELPEVWPNITEMLLSGDDSYLNKLSMLGNGWPNTPLMIPTDIIRNISTNNIFQGLISELESQGYKQNIDLFVFPYDWRWFIDWTAGNDSFPNILSLKEKIDEVKNQTGASKVDIIAHSMGGLIVKKYVYDFGNDSINKFIDIATPHLGAPKAFKILMYGDDLGFNVSGIFGLNPSTINHISQNMPSIYQLLPSEEYFYLNNSDYRSYIADIHDFDNNNAKGDLNYGQTMEFLINTGKNSNLLQSNNELHNQIDNFTFNKTFNIIGCGLPTLGKIYILNKEKTNNYEYAVKYINGDGTVPMKSAEHMLSSEKYYSAKREHPYLPSANGIKQLIFAILSNNENNFDFSKYNNLSEFDSICALSGTQISFHSPIGLHIYDENNNHLGPDENGNIEFGIAGAQYDIIENNKFAFLPFGHNYTITGKASDTGSFNARIQKIENSQYVQTFYFNEIPLNSTSTVAKIEINDEHKNYVLLIDQDNDNVFESSTTPSSVLNQEQAEDTIKPITQINLSGNLNNDNYYASDVFVELIATDNENGSGILKTEYSVNNGQTWQNYAEQVVLNQNKEYNILYKSTDKAGNIEECKEKKIKISKIENDTGANSGNVTDTADNSSQHNPVNPPAIIFVPALPHEVKNENLVSVSNSEDISANGNNNIVQIQHNDNNLNLTVKNIVSGKPKLQINSKPNTVRNNATFNRTKKKIVKDSIKKDNANFVIASKQNANSETTTAKTIPLISKEKKKIKWYEKITAAFSRINFYLINFLTP